MRTFALIIFTSYCCSALLLSAIRNTCASMKAIKKILPATRPHWVGDGFNVYPVFSQLAFTNDISPFLMFDYGAPKKFEPSSKKRGVGQHPHRGFETVTIAYQGEVEHADSVGHTGLIGPGDVQWMTAGAGIVHEEYHSKKFTAEGGTLEMAQLWVNLPREHKMTAPHYQPILNADIPVRPLPDDAGDVRVIAGEFSDTKGAATTFSPVNVWDVRLLPGKVAELTVPAGHNTLLFVRKGRVTIGDSGAKELGMAQVAILEQEGTAVRVENSSAEETLLLLLGGQPLNEPIAARGPFVMNTQEELMQAMVDYSEGRLGRHFN